MYMIDNQHSNILDLWLWIMRSNHLSYLAVKAWVWEWVWWCDRVWACRVGMSCERTAMCTMSGCKYSRFFHKLKGDACCKIESAGPPGSLVRSNFPACYIFRKRTSWSFPDLSQQTRYAVMVFPVSVVFPDPGMIIINGQLTGRGIPGFSYNLNAAACIFTLSMSFEFVIEAKNWYI